MNEEDGAARAREGAAGSRNRAPSRARTLYSGDFHPHLEEAFLTHMAGPAGENPADPVFVVVPTNYLGIRLSRALAERSGGHLNVRFMTLKDLAARCAPVPLPGGRSMLPRGGDAVVVRRILDEGIADGGYFSDVAERPGMAPVLLAAIRDLKEASYSPKSFLDAAREGGLLRGGRRGKCAELARLWSAYEAFLADRERADDADLMRYAAELLESAGSDRAAGRLIVYGFYDLNALQKRLLAAVFGEGPATVYFPYVDTPALDYARPTLDWFLSLGFERRPLGGDARALPLPPETLVVSAPGEAREAREVVRTMRRIVEERDLSLQDAAVILRAPDVYSDLFGQELDGLCDPHTRDRRRPGSRTSFLETTPGLSRTRSGLSLLRLADAVGSGFARSDVIEFLTVAPIAPSACGDAQSEPPVSEWNAVSSLAGITSGARQWLERTEALAERLERAGDAEEQDAFARAHGRLAAPARSLREILGRIVEPLAGLASRATPEEYLSALAGVFSDVTCRDAERDEVLAAAGRVRGISQLAGEVTFGYFTELLHRFLDASSPRGARFGVGGPSVLSSMSARGLSYKLVVVPGLVERQFPLHRRQDPVLLDDERTRLNEAIGGSPLRRLPLRAPGMDEERLLFRLAVGSAQETLILTYPRLDPATARPRVPSVFVLDALEEMTGRKHDYAAIDVSDRVIRVPLSRRFPPSRREALTRREFDGCSALEAVESGDATEVAYLLAEGLPLRPGVEMEETRWSSPYFTRFDGALSSDDALEAAAALAGLSFDGSGGRPVSATALEEYARCPFRFLVHRVLGIDPLEEPEESLEYSPLDRGSLYHEILERFMREMRRSGRVPLDDSVLPDLLKTADRTLGAEEWSLAGYEGARELERRLMRLNLAIWLRSEIAEETDYVPAHFEVRFGGRERRGDDALSTEETVHFDAGEGVGLAFGGRIDRVDVSPDTSRARIIDYKTGDPRNVKPPLDRGRHLQLPVYLLAARALFERSHTRVESAEYRFVTSGPRSRPLRVTDEELSEQEADFAAAVRLIVHGIESGMFFPFPEDRSCKNCDYAPACGPIVLALARMKQGDPNAEFYISDLAGIE
ncbi:MAG: hypothetical protein GF400_02820 [Candidatus Eisenbacteria bacterium]|nr:hypothetical protein [Candidatus Eisenbacteria bacterium]